MLALTSLTPIATGRLRFVFRHPAQPHLLVKIIRRDVADERQSRRWYKRLARTGPYSVYLREIREYLAARARHPDAAVPLVGIVGLVETDLGLGLVQEAVLGDDGALAPTLRDLVLRDGLTPAIESALAAFVEALLRHDVIVGDMHPGNIVYGFDAHGGSRFVLVDGFGEKNVLPYCSWSPWLNARHTRQRYAVLRRKLDKLLTERASRSG
jgi:hypothetical protein